MLKKKIWASVQRIIELFIQKLGLGSGIRKNLFRIPDPAPGVKKAPDPGSRIRIPTLVGNGDECLGVPQHDGRDGVILAGDGEPCPCHRLPEPQHNQHFKPSLRSN
jgi:hypothetical protein